MEPIVSLKKIRFTETLIDANNIDPNDFLTWVFRPGMDFNSPDKWWGDHGKRDFPHEGIDFCLYRHRSGQVHQLDDKTRIPVIQDGMVMAVFKDYLGQAIVIEHEHPQTENEKYLSIYAHTTPMENLQPGVLVQQGDIIATIAGTDHSKAIILPHLHFTLGYPSSGLTYEAFVWNRIRDSRMMTLMNPMDVIE